MAVKVINNSEKIQRMFAENLRDAGNSVGLYIKGEAMKNIKKNGTSDFGFLIDSIYHELDAGYTAGKKLKVKIGSTKKYAIYVEKGTGIYAVDGNGRQTPWVYFYKGHKGRKGYRITVGQKPQPFLTPAGEQNIDTIIKIAAEQLKKGFG